LNCAYPSGKRSSASEFSKKVLAPRFSSRRMSFRAAQLNLTYVLSPRPKQVYLSWDRHPGGSFLRKSFLQKSRELCGMSPWPVVEMTKRTSPCCNRAL
jgi:hypothetical protein